MKALAAGFLVFLTACAGAPVSQEVLKLVPLIKAEKYDEAAAIDPDLMAPAFVEALREMKAEGADPKRVVAIANFFFDHYPFSIKDIEISERVFSAVADVHFEASVQIHPALPTCADLRRATTFAGKLEVLLPWKGPHVDGGRCGRDIVEFLERARQRGPAWAADLPNGDEDPSPRRAAKDLLDACWDSFQDQPEYVLVVFKIAALQSLIGGASCETWDRDPERWSRIAQFRLAWLMALTWHPIGYPNYRAVAGIGELWQQEREPRLRDLGRALASWKTTTSDFGNHRLPNSATYGPILAELDRVAKGTPFPDFARLSLIHAWSDLEPPDRVEKIILEWWREFADPFYPTLLLWFVADRLREETEDWKADPVKSMRLAKEVIDRDPGGELAPGAWLTIARLHQKAGREREKFDCLLAALKRPSLRSRYEHTFLAEARSSAGAMLAKHYESAGDWTRALEAWRVWEPYAYCGEGWAGIDAGLHGGLGRCLDRLGKPAEAAPHLWELVDSYWTNVETAKRLKEIHEFLGTTRELTEKVRLAVQKNPENEGLKWLAEALGVFNK